MNYTLGQKVTVTDHLFRTRAISPAQVVALSAAWPYMPQKVTEDARTLLERQSARRHGLLGRYKVWLPVSLGPWKHNDDWGTLGVDTRRHPVVHDLPMPTEGVVVRQVQIQDGEPFWEEYGSEWSTMSSRVGYHVAYHLSRRPLVVLPHMIEPTP